MGSKLKTALKEAEKNIYEGVNLFKGTVVFIWALLCLFAINNIKSFLWATASGVFYYMSMFFLCTAFFKGINKYLGFPGENKKMPVFIGHIPDTLFVYPVLLMSLIGIIGHLITNAGFYPDAIQQIGSTDGKFMELIARTALLPLAAFVEEMFNLLLVSFFYMNTKLPGYFRLAWSVLAAALVFGFMHSFGWGLYGSVLIGISYLPVFFATLYTGNIWISFLAHFYNNTIFLTKNYYGSYFFIIIAVISFIPASWAVSTLFRRTR